MQKWARVLGVSSVLGEKAVNNMRVLVPFGSQRRLEHSWTSNASLVAFQYWPSIL